MLKRIIQTRFYFLRTVKVPIKEHKHAANAAGVAEERTHKRLQHSVY